MIEPHPKKHNWLKYILITLSLSTVISPCILCFWFFGGGREIALELSLRTYPGAQRVANAYGYYGAGSGQKAVYYWTPDSIETVQNYFEEFTFPFVEDRWNYLSITVFSVDGSELVSYDVDGSRRDVDYAREPRCHYTQRYTCANVWLMRITSDGLSYVPEVIDRPGSSSIANATPFLSTPLMTGTLIIYSYYITDY